MAHRASDLPDPRTGINTQFEMADIPLSAFAVFLTQCPSFLSFQQNMEKPQGRNNARSLFFRSGAALRLTTSAKHRGYHREHNFGHGKKHLASLLMTLNWLTFGRHTLLELTDASCRLIRATVGVRRKYFKQLAA